MPQTYAARAERWPGGDTQATQYLENNGWKLSRDGRWEWTPSSPAYVGTARDHDALCYLIEEWDYGGWPDGMNWEARDTPGFTEADYDEAFQFAPKWVEPEEPRWVEPELSLDQRAALANLEAFGLIEITEVKK